MRDRQNPDTARLFALADAQLGYFTARQARECGYASSMLAYHVARQRFARVGWGVYRFVQYPHSAHEHVVAAWLAVGPDSVVSHETALDLHGLSDVIPATVHLTVPRARRSRRAPTGVTLHTTTRPISERERMTHPESGLPVTTPIRTILDVTAAGAPFEEVTKAVEDALAVGLITAGELREAAATQGVATHRVVERALDEAADTLAAS
jgi:predicted transcriptional regulator of viral defense system